MTYLQKNQATLNEYLTQESVVNKLKKTVGDANFEIFKLQLLNIYANDLNLRNCTPQSLIKAGVEAFSLGLNINPKLGLCYFIPYGNEATLQLSYKGLVQLCLRSGMFLNLNVFDLREGESVKVNIITGKTEIKNLTFELNQLIERENKPVLAYGAYFKLTNGFEKYLIMTIQEIKKHAERYSRVFNNAKSVWQTDFDSMARKTVLKKLLSKWGVLEIIFKNYESDILKSDLEIIEEPQPNTTNTTTADEIKNETAQKTPAEAPAETPTEQPKKKLTYKFKNEEKLASSNGDELADKIYNVSQKKEVKKETNKQKDENVELPF